MIAQLSPSPESMQDTRQALRTRTREVLSREIQFIPNPRFRALDADEMWRTATTTPEPETNARSGRSAMPYQLEQMCSAPLLSPAEERDLFCRMNYFKYRANAIRSTLNERRPSLRKLNEIERLLAKASEIRNRIVHANTRLIVSIVKSFANDPNSFDDLFSDGITCMLNAVEKFDFDRGFRFSTYATMAIRRDALRSIKKTQRERSRMGTVEVNTIEQQVEDERSARRTASDWHRISSDLSQLLSRLDDRERYIVQARYGFIDVGDKPTFSKLGEQLGISKERVRQLQLRAMNKLRDGMEELKMTELEDLT